MYVQTVEGGTLLSTLGINFKLLLLQQMFVLIADIQGSHITVAYGYLPDKKQMSYALFLYLILDAFEAYQEDFRAIT